MFAREPSCSVPALFSASPKYLPNLNHFRTYGLSPISLMIPALTRPPRGRGVYRFLGQTNSLRFFHPRFAFLTSCFLQLAHCFLFRFLTIFLRYNPLRTLSQKPGEWHPNPLSPVVAYTWLTL